MLSRDGEHDGGVAGSLSELIALCICWSPILNCSARETYHFLESVVWRFLLFFLCGHHIARTNRNETKMPEKSEQQGSRGPGAPKSLDKVWKKSRESGRGLDKVAKRRFRDLFQPLGGGGGPGPEAPGDCFETLSGFGARRARETPVNGQRVPNNRIQFMESTLQCCQSVLNSLLMIRSQERNLYEEGRYVLLMLRDFLAELLGPGGVDRRSGVGTTHIEDHPDRLLTPPGPRRSARKSRNMSNTYLPSS